MIGKGVVVGAVFNESSYLAPILGAGVLNIPSSHVSAMVTQMQNSHWPFSPFRYLVSVHCDVGGQS